MAEPKISSNDALIVVDMQNDFCPGGALPVEGGHDVVTVLNRWISAAERTGALVVASRDWHPKGHASFKDQGGDWPPHCIQDTRGAEFHPDVQLPDDALIITKGDDIDRDQYSAFDDTGLADRLRSRNIQRVWVGGLAQDVCVRATVLDGLDEGFEIHLIREATRAVNANPGDGDRALDEMRQAGAVVEQETAE